MLLAHRMSRTSPSATLAMDALARQMRADGIDVIGLGVGEPDFDTPDNVKKAAIQAIEDGFTKYTPAGGVLPLKEAIAQKLLRDNGLHYDPAEIMVTVGAKHALFNVFQVLLNPGDEVIVPAPYWVSYIDQIRLTGAEAIVVQGDKNNAFKITAGQVREAVTERTKALVINSPCNPTGAVYDRTELHAIARAAVEADILLISDEIYEPFVYGDAKHVSVPALSDAIKAKTILVHGVSKSHSMTGWRIGYAAAHRDIIAAMTSIQSHSTSNPTSIAQMAAIEALTGTQQPVRTMVTEFGKRRDYVVERLRNLAGVQVTVPAGAFYAFPDISAAVGKQYNGTTITDCTAFATTLLEQAHVALVPGAAFGLDGYVRLSYATSMDNIERAMDRLESFWNTLV